MAMSLESLQRDFNKYVDQTMKEGKQAKQTAKQKARQQQALVPDAVVATDAVVASEAPAPGKKRGRKPKSEVAVAPLAQ